MGSAALEAAAGKHCCVLFGITLKKVWNVWQRLSLVVNLLIYFPNGLSRDILSS
jgi:hypothetical protein